MDTLQFKPSVYVRDAFCTEERPDPCGLVIFGASGDLTARKLMPALFSLFRRRLVSGKFFVLGCGRTEMTDDAFRAKVREDLREYVRDVDRHAESLDAFVERCHYQAGLYRENRLYEDLRVRLEHLAGEHATEGNVLYYLSVPPSLYSDIANHVARAGLAIESRDGKRWSRVIIEKPFGHDLESALELDQQIHRALAERQIYRIDHYLGKETVQNILMFRFANAIFEPLLNNHYVDRVEVTVAESIGVGDRGGYFEQAGMMRDMFQNHMMQMTAMVAMEPPSSFSAEFVRDEKVKLLRAIRPFDLDDLDSRILRGQYAGGAVDGKQVKGYRQEKEVPADSWIDTYVAARLWVDNWRWQGVPFYLRTGKRLGRRLSEIAITFKRVPHSMFKPLRPEDLAPNTIILTVQPDEGISLGMVAKHPGPKLCMSALEMDFRYGEVFDEPAGEAYERLLLDAMLGDQTLFVRSDEMQVAWELITPVLHRWAEQAADGVLHPYVPGSWGPDEANALPAADGRCWRNLDRPDAAP
jgi:glucose-6-phosphate 1-dehydrogenase